MITLSVNKTGILTGETRNGIYLSFKMWYRKVLTAKQASWLIVSPQVAQSDTGLSPGSISKDIVLAPATTVPIVVPSHGGPSPSTTTTSSVPHGRLGSSFLTLARGDQHCQNHGNSNLHYYIK